MTISTESVLSDGPSQVAFRLPTWGGTDGLHEETDWAKIDVMVKAPPFSGSFLMDLTLAEIGDLSSGMRDVANLSRASYKFASLEMPRLKLSVMRTKTGSFDVAILIEATPDGPRLSYNLSAVDVESLKKAAMCPASIADSAIAKK